MTIKQGQIWASIDTEFVITNYDGEWVHYKNTRTGQMYHCLEGAFRQRFSPVINRG